MNNKVNQQTAEEKKFPKEIRKYIQNYLTIPYIYDII